MSEKYSKSACTTVHYVFAETEEDINPNFMDSPQHLLKWVKKHHTNNRNNHNHLSISNYGDFMLLSASKKLTKSFGSSCNLDGTALLQ